MLTHRYSVSTISAYCPLLFISSDDELGVGCTLSEDVIPSKKVEIELQYFEDTSSELKIVDLVLVNSTVLPAWEYRSNFKKSKTEFQNGSRRLELYYTAKINVGCYICRLTVNRKTKISSYLLVTENGKVELSNVPEAVKFIFEQFSI